MYHTALSNVIIHTSLANNVISHTALSNDIHTTVSNFMYHTMLFNVISHTALFNDIHTTLSNVISHTGYLMACLIQLYLIASFLQLNLMTLFIQLHFTQTDDHCTQLWATNYRFFVLFYTHELTNTKIEQLMPGLRLHVGRLKL